MSRIPDRSFCHSCQGRDGTAKRTYPTESDAESAADHRRSRGGPTLRVYPCPWGDGWHLTKE